MQKNQLLSKYKLIGKRVSFLLLSFYLFSSPQLVFATMPASTNYKIQDYSFGAGGTKASTSESYGLNAIAGEVAFGKPGSTNYQIGAGLTYLMQAHVPPAPTLSNPSTNYDRLKIVINTGDNPTDATYEIAISTDNFATDTRYVKSDNTIGTTLTTADFRTYLSWGGATGVYITGLQRNTTYYVKAKALQGDFTESKWGPASSGVATADPSLTFSVDSSSITFSNLNSNNAHTDSSKTTTLTTSTNAYNGYVVNARETAPLTAGSNTIADYVSPNSAPTSWTGTGFGYTTSDSDLAGGAANRFTNGGPNYAGFTTSSPGDPVADHPGPVLTAISNEQFTISYRVTVNSSQQAARYNTTILYVVVPSY